MVSEKRLIDANKAQAVLMNMAERLMGAGSPEMAVAVGYAAEVIGKQRTVDAVEVVRCKDCKYWHEETGWCDQHSWFIEEDGEPCHPWESNNWKMLNEDDFCSYGERKDNADL